MTDEQARIWLIKATLLVTSVCFAFFLVAPVLDYPLTFNQSTRILQIILPIFLGYLGSASHYVFISSKRGESDAFYVSRPGGLFPLLVRGPVAVFAVAMAATIFAFGYSNRASATPGTGMSIDALAIFVSAALGILAATTSLVLARLFSSGDEAAAQPAEPGVAT